MRMKAKSKLTENCFTDSSWSYRDSDFDVWLPKKQPEQEGEITVIVRDKYQTFLEMAQEYIGTTDPEKIKPHCLTLPMVEEMIEKHSADLQTLGHSNFFFVENEDGSVSIAGVYRGDPRWNAFVYGIDRGFRRIADLRLLVRNLDASKFEDLEPVLNFDSRIAKLEKAVFGKKKLRDGRTLSEHVSQNPGFLLGDGK
jgi:hypothetical protein